MNDNDEKGAQKINNFLANSNNLTSAKTSLKQTKLQTQVTAKNKQRQHKQEPQLIQGPPLLCQSTWHI